MAVSISEQTFIAAGAAHSPMYEEPLLVKEILENDVLHGKIDLADVGLQAF